MEIANESDQELNLISMGHINQSINPKKNASPINILLSFDILIHMYSDHDKS